VPRSWPGCCCGEGRDGPACLPACPPACLPAWEGTCRGKRGQRTRQKQKADAL
jgi:hypothetical protein